MNINPRIDTQIGFNQLPSSYGDFPISAVNTKLQWQLGQLFNSSSSVKLKSEIGVSYDSEDTFIRENYELYYNSSLVDDNSYSNQF